jgi:O-acetyl-ADP-ribose deacetylase
VAFDPTAHTDIRAHLASPTPIRILQGIRVLHQRGYHRVRPRPGLGGAGMWRVTITAADDLNDSIRYSIGALTEFASGEVNITTSPETVADLILNALPEAAPTADDPEYVSWFADLMQLVESTGRPPISYDDYSDHRD